MKKFLTLITTVFLCSIQCFMIIVRADGPGSISSHSAILYEPQSGRALFEKDAHTKRPMASTTKIMTALLAVEKCPPDMVVTVTDEAVRVEGSALGLCGGDKITMIDLVTGLLLESGNDAANVIAYTVSGSIKAFADLMNKRAAEIGMKNTVFVTPSGLDQGEHSSTAWDMALLAAECLNNEIIASICEKKSAVIKFGNPPRNIRVSNHNRLLQLYPHAIGMKTGFTKKSGRCLVSAAQKDGVRLIGVTLKAGDDWNDHIAMYEYGFSITKLVSLPVPKLPPVQVTGGLNSHISPTVKIPPQRVMLKSEEKNLRVDVALPHFVFAPVCAGDVIGNVRYSVGDSEILRLDITASQNVKALPPPGFIKRFGRKFTMLFTEWLKL